MSIAAGQLRDVGEQTRRLKQAPEVGQPAHNQRRPVGHDRASRVVRGLPPIEHGVGCPMKLLRVSDRQYASARERESQHHPEPFRWQVIR